MKALRIFIVTIVAIMPVPIPIVGTILLSTIIPTTSWVHGLFLDLIRQRLWKSMLMEQ